MCAVVALADTVFVKGSGGGGGGGGTWGTITGALSSQTDLWTELTNRYTKAEINTVQTSQESVAFSASTEEDWTHSSLAYSTIDITRGRLWVSDTNNSPIDVTVTLTWYTTSDRRGEDALYRASMSLVQVLANGSAPAGTNAVTVDDGSSFSANNLVVIYDGDSTEFARITSVSTNVLTFEDNLVSAMDDDAGVSRVAEYGGFSLHGSNQTVWAGATFSSIQTVNLSNWMEYIK
jgi:hypothetical protein